MNNKKQLPEVDSVLAPLPPLPTPKDHTALDLMEEALKMLQKEQEEIPAKKRAIVVTNLETAILWQKHAMGLVPD
jgi:hypothetical protein